MSDVLPAWVRPRFVPGGANATLLYALYGEFTPHPRDVAPAEYRTAGLPPEFELRRVRAEDGPALPFMGGDLAKVLREDYPALIEQAAGARECLVIKGEFADPPDLNYLRDAVGMIAWFFDQGAIAAVDPQRLRAYGPVDWWEEVFAPAPPKLSAHVVIVSTREKEGSRWLHTRGMRKFGRPDLSMRGVAQGQEPGAIELVNRLIVLQAEGDRIPEGQTIQMRSLPPGLTCHHTGSFEDPAFNNVHVEIVRTREFSF